jgi:hypothetical protein
MSVALSILGGIALFLGAAAALGVIAGWVLVKIWKRKRQSYNDSDE